jgi:hypothetical protein
MKRLLTTLLIALAIAASITVAAPAGANDGPAIEPAFVDEIIFPGQSIDIDKSVYTPAIPPDPEIYFLVDTTGSMGGVISEVQTEIGLIIAAILLEQPTAEFGLGQYKDFPFDPFAYQHMVSIGGDVPGAVAGLLAGGGADGPEGQFYALDQIAKNNTAGFSGDDGSTPIIVWVGDAPAHEPVCAAISGLAYDIDEASVTADLVAAGYTVVALSTSTGYADGLDDDPTLLGGDYLSACGAEGGAPGQATRITDATGGTALADVGPGDVTQAILDALSAVQIEVSMTSDCAYPIDTDFLPVSVVTESGEVVNFTETISVASDAPGGVYECQDWALIDGEPMVDEAGAIIYETKTILVPENFVTGGGHVTIGKGKYKTDILTHGGNAGYMADGSLVGHWNFNMTVFDPTVRVQTTEITGLQFSNTGLDPAPPDADADTAVMTADARVRVGNAGWWDDCTLEATFVDGGEPQEDAITITVDCPSYSWGIYGFEVTGGNIQMHDGTKG